MASCQVQIDVEIRINVVKVESLDLHDPGDVESGIYVLLVQVAKKILAVHSHIGLKTIC